MTYLNSGDLFVPCCARCHEEVDTENRIGSEIYCSFCSDIVDDELAADAECPDCGRLDCHEDAYPVKTQGD
jgi:DNA-directed RNA polymerase subunit RPC12/RpoP